MNGDAVFRKTALMTDMLDESISSPIIAIIDNPILPRIIASTLFDGKGNVTRKITIVDRGCAKAVFYNSQTARRSKS